jgi:hypothetical protein
MDRSRHLLLRKDDDVAEKKRDCKSKEKIRLLICQSSMVVIVVEIEL